MPVMRKVYDRTPDEGAPSDFMRDSVTAKECCDNDPGRYRLTPWPKMSARDAKAADKAAARKPARAAKKSADPEPAGDESPPASEPAGED